MDKEKTFYETNYSCIFFHQKWFLKNNLYLQFLDTLFLFFTFLKYKSDKNVLFNYNRSFIRQNQIQNKFLYQSTNTKNYLSFLSLANYG